MKLLRRGSWMLDPSYSLFVFVLLLRLVVLARLAGSSFLLPNSGDMQFYNEWAQRIMRGELTNHHAFYGLPLYPYLLALLYKVFGYNPFLPGLFQAIFEAGTAVLLLKIAVEIFGRSSAATVTPPFEPEHDVLEKYRGVAIGLLAALGWGFFLPAQAYSTILMPTAGLVFVFWFLVWQIVRRHEAPNPAVLFLLGALMGVTAMGIATILFLAPLVLAAALFKWKRRPTQLNSFRSQLIAAALFIFGIGAGASPCGIHNYFAANDAVFLSAHSGVNFWIGNNPLATGYPRFPPGLHAGQRAMLQDSITTAEQAAGHPLKRSEISEYWSAKTRSYIKDNFAEWAKLILVKIKNFWNAFQYDDLSIITILREQDVLLPGVRFGLVAALAIPGLLIAAARYPASRWVTVAVLLHMASLLTVFVTERYRLAAVPGLLLGASFGVWQFWQSCTEKRLAQVAIYLLLLLAGTLFVSIPQKDSSLWALDAYNSGWQALQVNNLPLAETKLKTAYAYASENSEVNFAIGNLRLAQRNKQGARAAYGVSLRLDPRNLGALNNLGVLALQDREWLLAQKFLEKAVREEPKDAKTHYLLAQAHFGAGDSDGANVEIEKALDLAPDQSEFLKFREQIRGGTAIQAE